MATLEDLVLFENANSSLAFREHAYAPGDEAHFLKDALALANAEVEGPRFLFIGVRDAAGDERKLPGVDAAALGAMRRILPALLAGVVDPPFNVALRALDVRGAKIGLLCFSECANAPYLLRKNVAGLPAGVGWLRRGTRQTQLTRTDLQRLFAQRLAAAPAGADVRVVFAGQPPREELELSVLDLEGLPSAAAAGKLREMLDAKKDAKDVLGRTETRFNRLLHVRIFGADKAYEKHSDESLRLMIDKTKDEYALADRHYALTVRTHKLDLVACNRGTVALESVMLRLRLPNLPGVGVAERVYPATGLETDSASGYPLVTVGKRVIDIEAGLGTLAPGANVAVFREPPRLWVREAAAGKSIPLDYTVHARGLREPVRDTLVIRIVPAKRTATTQKRRNQRARAR